MSSIAPYLMLLSEVKNGGGGGVESPFLIVTKSYDESRVILSVSYNDIVNAVTSGKFVFLIEGDAEWGNISVLSQYEIGEDEDEGSPIYTATFGSVHATLDGSVDPSASLYKASTATDLLGF